LRRRPSFPLSKGLAHNALKNSNENLKIVALTSLILAKPHHQDMYVAIELKPS